MRCVAVSNAKNRPEFSLLIAFIVCALPAVACAQDSVAALPARQENAASGGGGSGQATGAVQVLTRNNGRPQVRLVGFETDVAKRYRGIIPPLPVAPFNEWRQWFKDHENAVHCLLEWRDDKGEWWHAELRSSHYDPSSEQYRVGGGEFPGTAYDAYGIYVLPGGLDRVKDRYGKPVVVVFDQEVPCDYRQLEAEIRGYGDKSAIPGTPGTGGHGEHNVGLGGPAYKPAQNSNTMVKYVLRKCGVVLKAPDRAVGWDTEPTFPYSSNADSPVLDRP